MGYEFVATDRLGTPYGEIREANPRSLRFPISNSPSFTWTIDADHPQAQQLSDVGRTLVKVYDDTAGAKVLRMIGPVVSREKTRGAGSGEIALVAAAPTWRLARRLVGRSSTGASIGTSLAPVDRGTMISQILDALHLGSTTLGTRAGDTGIRIGNLSASSSTFAGPWYYKPAAEILTELTAPLDGPDWRIRPTEPTPDSIGVRIGLLDLQPFIGALQPNVIWEFGSGRLNVETWRDVGDASALANAIDELPSGFPDSAGTDPVVSASDSTSISTNGYGLNEIAMSSGIVVQDLRQRLVNEHLAIRKVPRRVITFEPVAEDPDPSLPLQDRRVPRLFVDYNPGDIVVFRATERFKVVDQDGTVLGYRDVQTVNAYFRVYAVTLNFDDAGVAKPTLTLVSDENTQDVG